MLEVWLASKRIPDFNDSFASSFDSDVTDCQARRLGLNHHCPKQIQLEWLRLKLLAKVIDKNPTNVIDGKGMSLGLASASGSLFQHLLPLENAIHESNRSDDTRLSACVFRTPVEHRGQLRANSPHGEFPFGPVPRLSHNSKQRNQCESTAWNFHTGRLFNWPAKSADRSTRTIASGSQSSDSTSGLDWMAAHVSRSRLLPQRTDDTEVRPIVQNCF